ncbi:hypothetical protein [Sutcliffiella cohnii]|nr:hypothetical protein [Sutcliffiella cohnii]
MKIYHKLFVTYYSILIEDCLDEELKMQLKKKLFYHHLKLGM